MIVSDDEPGLDIDLLSASLRADASDLHAFVEALAVKLEEALPGGVRVDRRRSGLRGPRTVRAISVTTEGERLELRAQDGMLQTLYARTSGGIVLKNETVDTDEWLIRLSAALAAQARTSQTTRQALERLLNG